MDDNEKTYIFTVNLSGRGTTPAQAWSDAVDYMLENIKDMYRGDIPDYEEVEDD